MVLNSWYVTWSEKEKKEKKKSGEKKSRKKIPALIADTQGMSHQKREEGYPWNNWLR